MSAAVPPPKPTVFFILGGPGSGKGTNCSRLVQDFGYVHFSAGDLLREEAKKDSELGKKITDILKRGEIVPSEVTVALLADAIQKHPASNGYLIDGFPRKLDQARMFEEGIAKAKGILYFDCTEQTMEQRCLHRLSCGSTRSDDDPEVLRRRFRTNLEQCMPVVEKYDNEKRLIRIDANKSVDEVYSQVLDIFTKQLGATRLHK